MKRRDQKEPIEPLAQQAAEQAEQNEPTAGNHTATPESAAAARTAAVMAAEGQAEAIIKVQEATARGLVMIRQAGVDQSVIAIKSLEALERLGDGQATKIIIPSEIQSLAGLALSLGEITASDRKAGSD